jgi:hypothetical protein
MIGVSPDTGVQEQRGQSMPLNGFFNEIQLNLAIANMLTRGVKGTVLTIPQLLLFED